MTEEQAAKVLKAARGQAGAYASYADRPARPLVMRSPEALLAGLLSQS
jgi:hypothetical protein